MFNKIKMVLILSVLSLGLAITGLSTKAALQTPSKAPAIVQKASAVKYGAAAGL